MRQFLLKTFAVFARVGLLYSSLSLTHVYADASAEYEVKAAFLYNFAIFTEWPDKATETFSLCILGKDQFGGSLDNIAGKMVGNAALVNRHLINVDGILRGCQMLFISLSERDNLSEILDVSRSAGVLTVTELPGAAQQGVMIELKTDGKNKITFDINLTVLRQAKLNISSKILRLAQSVY